MQLNNNFENLAQSYLFSKVAAEVRKYTSEHPEAKLIRMDIGDVTRPICEASIQAMHRAVDDLAKSETFHGYGPEQGYSFLRDAIAANDYIARGIEIASDEIFISDGAKSDIGNLGDLFSLDNRVAISDPAYPVYIDANVMDGREDIEMLSATESNGFKPALPLEKADIIYLCYPNNPTGVTLTRADLERWVQYALENDSIIIYDSAYERYIRTEDVPHSIYEIPGAEKCAIEVRSFSKTAGFTGLRCGYTVVPHALKRCYNDGTEVELNALWNRRQCTKFNGASYVAQRAAEAIYTPEGKNSVDETVNYYMNNARILHDGLTKVGFTVFGGTDSPYVWVKAPEGKTSWEMFFFLLEKCQLTCTPGSGFGKCGEGFVRLTAFNTLENTLEAIERISRL